MSLAGKKIVLGVSGGIAAYKTPELVRRLRDRGADVRVAMTEAAKAFITPLSLQAVSGYPVSDSLLDPAAEAAMGHIELGKWADLVILAPATADLIARIAAGMANDLVSTICLATPAPVAVLPAMNQQMYRAAATQHNLEVLASRGLLIWGPDSGSQACGDIGPGRMLDPLTIVDMAVAHFSPVNDLKHLNIMITAGPTREPLDPVRYISNHSSGKMGFAIAAAAARRGVDLRRALHRQRQAAADGGEIELIKIRVHRRAATGGGNVDLIRLCREVDAARDRADVDRLRVQAGDVHRRRGRVGLEFFKRQAARDAQHQLLFG